MYLTIKSRSKDILPAPCPSPPLPPTLSTQFHTSLFVLALAAEPTVHLETRWIFSLFLPVLFPQEQILPTPNVLTAPKLR